jgi:hypothetical protein
MAAAERPRPDQAADLWRIIEIREMNPADYAARIRSRRADLTQYVVHVTRHRVQPAASAFRVLGEILESGYIRPTFAPRGQKNRPSIKGPCPAICFTDQPISALLVTCDVMPGHHTPYGIAYFKPTLFDAGARPAMYATKQDLGRRIQQGEPNWDPERELYTDGIPPELQYLFVEYDPSGVGVFNRVVDWTWEREWRLRFPNSHFSTKGLPVGIRNPGSSVSGAIVVYSENERTEIQAMLDTIRRRPDGDWVQYIGKVIALETARAKIAQGDQRYCRIETWPDA